MPSAEPSAPPNPPSCSTTGEPGIEQLPDDDPLFARWLVIRHPDGGLIGYLHPRTLDLDPNDIARKIGALRRPSLDGGAREH